MAEQNGLLSFLNSAAGQGLLGAAGAALSGNGNARQNIGRGLLGGIGAYGNAQDNQRQDARFAKQDQMYDLQMQQMQQQQAAQQQAREQQGMRQNYLGSVGKVTSPVIGAQPNRFDPMQWMSKGGSAEDAKALAGVGNWGKAAVKDYKDVRGADGSVQIVGFDEFGNQVKTGAQPFKAPEVRDFGGYIGGIDPITGQVSKYGAKSMSPGEAASNSLGWANHRLSGERLNFDKQQPKGQYDADRGLLIDPRTGEAKQVTMGGMPLGPKDKGPGSATEGERKAATLLSRLRGSQQQMDAVLKDEPGAAKPGPFAEMVRGTPWIGGDTPANLVTPGARQRVEAAQLDMLDAALTLGTGAAYTKEQLRGYAKSYFPQIGDDAKTVADKDARRKNLMQAAEIAAGRADPLAGKGGATGDWSIQEVK